MYNGLWQTGTRLLLAIQVIKLKEIEYLMVSLRSDIRIIDRKDGDPVLVVIYPQQTDGAVVDRSDIPSTGVLVQFLACVVLLRHATSEVRLVGRLGRIDSSVTVKVTRFDRGREMERAYIPGDTVRKENLLDLSSDLKRDLLTGVESLPREAREVT